MRFKINRTSDYGWDDIDRPPCDEAVFEGNNNGEKYWVIDFWNLEDLADFAKKYNRLILTSNSIEIYDDYRE